MVEPNPAQQSLIDATEGRYLVDAGAGTGKTFAITRRYARLVDQEDVRPEDVLLITFTRNAATEMRDRIVDTCTAPPSAFTDAPIDTFHGHCLDILEAHGNDAPGYLGIDDHITATTRVVEDETVEGELFAEFLRDFTDRHPEHHQFLQLVSGQSTLRTLVSSLTSRGIIPTTDGWYRESEAKLRGDREAFEAAFAECNRPQNNGRRQSHLRKRLGRYGRDSCFRPDAPSRAEIRGPRGEKAVPAHVADLVFDEDRDDLVSFVHDLLFEYLSFALSRNYLTFGFIQLFAFVLLCEDDDVRDACSARYTMIDEFQDTSEIQFKLGLLLTSTGNLCVVGDWKQSIYGFQDADVENILDFESRLERYAAELDAGTSADAPTHPASRVGFAVGDVTHIELDRNYRSTQSILDFAETTLTVPAKSSESVDESSVRDRLVPLESAVDREPPTRIEAIQSDDEYEAVLAKIQEVVGNDSYAIVDDGECRPPTYGDIAVFTRTREFGRELLSTAAEYEFPMAYEGGVELFRTDPAKLLLAWLRILQSDGDRGWAVVLEETGYAKGELEAMLSSAHYPDEMIAFRDRLVDLDSVAGITRRVFDRYGHRGAVADALTTTIQSMHETSTMTIGDLCRVIERAIESGQTHEIHAPAGDDAVTVQTIHAAKGLEYPVVIMANMNDRAFPPTGGRSGAITFHPTVGIRTRTLSDDALGHQFVYDNWRWAVLRRCLPDEMDEERRLLYVASTRAEQHLLFTAERPNTFLEELSVDIQSIDATVTPVDHPEADTSDFDVSLPPPDGPFGVSPHDLMDDALFDQLDQSEAEFQGRGTEFGTEVHDFAEAYVLARSSTDQPIGDESVTPRNRDEQAIVELIDTLDGALLTEEHASLPLTVDGHRVTISGIIDLLHVTPDRVEIIDYKTDRSRRGEAEYRKQLSVYCHVADAWYDTRRVDASLYYTATGERHFIDPLPMDEIEQLVLDVGIR